MAKRTFEDNLQWMVDKATASDLCEQSADYTRMIWSKDRRVMVVNHVTGEIVWRNDKQKAREEKGVDIVKP